MGRRKRRGAKRVFPAKFASDFINTTQKARFLVIDDSDPEGDKWFDNHSRVRTTAGPKTDKLPLPNSTFVETRKTIVRILRRGQDGVVRPVDAPRTVPMTREIPPTRGRAHHSYFDEDKQALVEAEQTPLEVVKLRISELRGQGWEEYHFILFSEWNGRRLELGFSGAKWIWRQTLEGKVRISAVYGGRQRAELALRENRIIWEPWRQVNRTPRT